MENKVLDIEEIEQLQSIQNKQEYLTRQFGELELFKIQLKNKRVFLEKNLQELESEKQTLSEFLENKYGAGTVNLKEGIFTPL